LARAMYHRKKYPYIKGDKKDMDAYREVVEKEDKE
jgi:hypothetical protein